MWNAIGFRAGFLAIDLSGRRAETSVQADISSVRRDYYEADWKLTGAANRRRIFGREMSEFAAVFNIHRKSTDHSPAC